VVSIVVSDSKVAGESSLLQVNRLEPESAEPQRHKKFKPVRIMDNLDLDILARFFGLRSIWTKSSWRRIYRHVDRLRAICGSESAPGNSWRMREHGTQQLSPWWQPGPGPCPLDCFFFQNQKELVSFAILQARIQQYASLQVLVMLQFKSVLPFCSYKHTFYKLVQSSHHIDIFSVHSPNKSQVLDWCIFSVHLLKRQHYTVHCPMYILKLDTAFFTIQATSIAI